jgi:hypothetical protein
MKAKARVNSHASHESDAHDTTAPTKNIQPKHHASHAPANPNLSESPHKFAKRCTVSSHSRILKKSASVGTNSSSGSNIYISKKLFAGVS